jgi:hypothetical protein
VSSLSRMRYKRTRQYATCLVGVVILLYVPSTTSLILLTEGKKEANGRENRSVQIDKSN